MDTIFIFIVALRKHPDPHYVFQLPWLSCLNIDPDELHIVHLGLAMYLLGSVLWLLCYDVLPGSPQDNMSVVWTQVCTHYAAIQASCQYTNLSLHSFCDPGSPFASYPKLKGRGAEVKDLIFDI